MAPTIKQNIPKNIPIKLFFWFYCVLNFLVCYGSSRIPDKWSWLSIKKRHLSIGYSHCGSDTFVTKTMTTRSIWNVYQLGCPSKRGIIPRFRGLFVSHWKWPAPITLAAVFTERIYPTKAISYCRIDVSHNKESASHENDSPQKRNSKLLRTK